MTKKNEEKKNGRIKKRRGKKRNGEEKWKNEDEEEQEFKEYKQEAPGRRGPPRADAWDEELMHLGCEGCFASNRWE